VVQQAHVHHCQRLLQFVGDAGIGAGGFRVAGRVVVAEDHRRRVVQQGAPDHFAGVDRCGADGAVEQLLAGDQAVAVVQEQGHEDLPGLPPQAVLQIAADRGRVVADRFAVFQLGGQVTVGQFQPGSQRTAARRAQPGQAGQLPRGPIEQHPQRAMRLQQVARGLHGIAAAEPGAEKQGQQFGVGK